MRIEGRFATPVECVALDASAFTSSPDEALAAAEIAATETEENRAGPRPSSTRT